MWLPDLVRWAEVCAALVRPGGTFYLAEFHPFPDVFGDHELDVAHPYFDPTGQRWDEEGTYTDRPDDAPVLATPTWNWTHPLGTVVTALIDAGLVLELLHEWDHTLWARWPWLEPHADGTYRMPAERPNLPLMYSIRARRP